MIDYECIRFNIQMKNDKFIPTDFSDFKEVDSRITKKGVEKIYILKYEDEFLYVGRAKNSITQRLNLGLYRNLNPKNGYHGYKWVDKFRNNEKILECGIVIFTGIPSESKIQDNSNMNIEYKIKNPVESLIEAIEAEIVFSIRYYERYWPKFQHETHFYNLFPKEIMAIATNIYFILKIKFSGEGIFRRNSD